MVRALAGDSTITSFFPPRGGEARRDVLRASPACRFAPREAGRLDLRDGFSVVLVMVALALFGRAPGTTIEQTGANPWPGQGLCQVRAAQCHATMGANAFLSPTLSGPYRRRPADSRDWPRATSHVGKAGQMVAGSAA